MASRSKTPGARHPRSPLPRVQTVREKLENVQRKRTPPIPSPRLPGTSGLPAAAPAARSRRMFPFTRGTYRVQ